MPRAGWYEDPGGAGYRWWDGSAWTAQVVAHVENPAPPQPPRRAAPRHAPGEADGAQRWAAAAVSALVALGAVLLVIGAIQPWVRAKAPGVGAVTRLGTDARAGWLIILSGVIVSLEAGRWLQRHRPSRRGAVVAMVTSLATAGVAIATFTHLAAGVASLPGATGTVTRTAGAGVPLIAAGCVAVFSGAVAAALQPVG